MRCAQSQGFGVPVLIGMVLTELSERRGDGLGTSEGADVPPPYTSGKDHFEHEDATASFDCSPALEAPQKAFMKA